MAAGVRLEPVGRFVGVRVLAWDRDVLYAGHGYDLLRWRRSAGNWETIGSYEANYWRCFTATHPLTARLLRDGYHALAVLPDGGLVVVLPRRIGILKSGARRVEPTFRVPRGTRPLSIATTPAGNIYWGEYFDNPRREAVHIYGSVDAGKSWEIVYTFSAGSIRHVHSIAYDPNSDCLWVTTGDEAEECRIIRVAPDWSSIEVVAAGNQQARAVSLVLFSDAIYFATDTPNEQNYIYRIRRNGHRDRLAPISGSSFWSCRVGEAIFISTAVEPSEVNPDHRAALFASADGTDWGAIFHWRRDGWPSRYFQYANIILPGGQNCTDILAATGLAVQGEDQVTHLWRVRIE